MKTSNKLEKCEFCPKMLKARPQSKARHVSSAHPREWKLMKSGASLAPPVRRGRPPAAVRVEQLATLPGTTLSHLESALDHARARRAQLQHEEAVLEQAISSLVTGEVPQMLPALANTAHINGRAN